MRIHAFEHAEIAAPDFAVANLGPPFPIAITTLLQEGHQISAGELKQGFLLGRYPTQKAAEHQDVDLRRAGTQLCRWYLIAVGILLGVEPALSESQELRRAYEGCKSAGRIVVPVFQGIEKIRH